MTFVNNYEQNEADNQHTGNILYQYALPAWDEYVKRLSVSMTHSKY